MRTVSENTIHVAVEKVDHSDSEMMERLISEFGDQQPILAINVLGMESLFEHSDDFFTLLDLSLLIWLSFQIEYKSIPPIREKDLLDWEKKTKTESDALSSLSQEELSLQALEIVSGMTQPLLNQFIIEELVSMEEENELLGGEEAAGQLFSILKMEIELLDAAINHPRMRVL